MCICQFEGRIFHPKFTNGSRQARRALRPLPEPAAEGRGVRPLGGRTALRAAQPPPVQTKAARRMKCGGREYAAFAEVI